MQFKCPTKQVLTLLALILLTKFIVMAKIYDCCDKFDKLVSGFESVLSLDSTE